METTHKIENLHDIANLKLQLSELKNQISEQEKIIRRQERMVTNTASKKGVIWDVAGCRPISYIRRSDGHYYDTKPNGTVYATTSSPGEFYGALIKMAKSIHAPEPVFVQRPENTLYPDSYDYENAHSLPLIEDLTFEQLQQSGEMVGKIVRIYNEYYIKNHPNATVFPRDRESYQTPISYDGI